MEQYYSVKQVSSNFSLPCDADKQTEDKMTDRRTDRWTDRQILQHHIRVCVWIFFFKLNLLPNYSLCSQGDNLFANGSYETIEIILFFASLHFKITLL